ncbi:hypothetical protein JVT61DRAFT_3824 [Boletus reticuloceps]|uniref:Uncharacterized protein n=1 Tax=Boletus reticuloceps TaxID=495285 RepID=A0A8I2YQ69_9AGAM|nr:hypothetical protein JVT61DRAFT_3824 [Boletus reticuloceps]
MPIPSGKHVFSAQETAAAGVTLPSAFVASKSPFGPPPARRAASETSADDGSGAGAGATQRVGGTRAAQWQPVAAPPPPPEEQAEGVQGEWVQVLYDYGSEVWRSLKE